MSGRLTILSGMFAILLIGIIHRRDEVKEEEAVMGKVSLRAPWVRLLMNDTRCRFHV